MQQHSNSLLLLLLLVLITGIVVCSPSTPRRSRVRRQNMKVRITATEDTIVMKFLRPHPNTKLEGYVLGYGSSIFSKQFIPLPEKGQPYMSEMDAEPKYLVAVQPIPTNKLKKHCTGKVQLEKPLHLVIGSVSPTSVLLSWGTLLKTPYDVNVMNECIEDGHYTVRYREKSRKWNYQTCPTSDTIIDNLKPNMVYEFGVQPSTKEGTGDWSRPLYHNISSTVTKGKVINKTLNRPTPPVKPLTPGPNSVPFSPQHVVHNKTVASQPLHRITSPKTSIAPTTTTRKAPVSTSGPTRSPVIKKQPIGGEHPSRSVSPVPVVSLAPKHYTTTTTTAVISTPVNLETYSQPNPPFSQQAQTKLSPQTQPTLETPPQVPTTSQSAHKTHSPPTTTTHLLTTALARATTQAHFLSTGPNLHLQTIPRNLQTQNQKNNITEAPAWNETQTKPVVFTAFPIISQTTSPKLQYQAQPTPKPKVISVKTKSRNQPDVNGQANSQSLSQPKIQSVEPLQNKKNSRKSKVRDQQPQTSFRDNATSDLLPIPQPLTSPLPEPGLLSLPETRTSSGPTRQAVAKAPSPPEESKPLSRPGHGSRILNPSVSGGPRSPISSSAPTGGRNFTLSRPRPPLPSTNHGVGSFSPSKTAPSPRSSSTTGVMRQAVHGNKRPNQVGKPSDHDKPMLKQGDKESILKPFPLVTVKPKQERRLQTTTPNPSLNSTHFDINENSSIFRPLPASDVDFMGKKRFVAPHVIYKTDKKPDEPCSITSSLTYFPEEEGGDQNVTSPPKVPPSNLTVVTVEGCPSFVILDWEKSDNETREYEVVSTSKGPNGQQVSVQTTNQTHTAVENLKPSSSYEFKVTPKNELGSGPSTDPVSFSTESADPRVSEYVSGKGAIWTQFPFKADSHSECNGKQYVKRTWYRKFVGIQLCNSLRYKIYLSDSLNGKFYNIGDQTGFGEDHCQFVDSFLDGRTGSQMTADQLPSRPGYFRALRQEPVNFGEIGGKSHVTYVGWYECGTPIPGKW
ncbi:target of Nesh-SH3-like isoform X2 [Gouania willdenowi]|uniref:Fibronectin type-III domain-containing protein n=1 Tax=Gouania willdenowi TaxID=441366 RepID=A0A8C5I6Q2_GOUWI|nr:target of Nesh-SH3 isoform X2 [Gouania willdenowi]